MARRIPRRHQPLSHSVERRVTWTVVLYYGASRVQRRPCSLPRGNGGPARAHSSARASYQASGLQGFTGHLGKPQLRATSPQRVPHLESCTHAPGERWVLQRFPPHRARVPRLAVGTQLDAQRSPCMRCGGPANASASALQVMLMAPTSGHPCPALCDPQRRRSQKGSEDGAVEDRDQGYANSCGRAEGGTTAQRSLPTVLMATKTASSRDPDGRKRKCGLSLH